ncbi:EAL domain, c-di-GMP-specific phosphodiesterase class I (or its enzymatically inactive variant) [Formivibrio citricus]|uniref:EAL domain, c-di-GMP-specific phosphodiesterase class I (Or its enzymatically inactive variant) n=1 Tax=Formivibrio citricus TaxID=83765 RepID=A0A1I4V753_9NEIS|nr:EAL domain-containing response regulator [Formivibrio citricus]SFM96978.1 EAL domain, c-di-GMP-specific phosphodiesterase class I (or its enzymatically inactive variant) [Formivibrio citricus]
MSNWKEYSILVVDDSAMQREFAVGLLREMGFEKIQQAADGVGAVHALELLAPDGVDFMLTDLDMPGVDGVELLREVAKHRWAQYLIVMSAREAGILDAVEGMASEDESIKLLCALPKPLSRNRLEQALSRAELGENGRQREGSDAWSASLDEIREAMEKGEFVPYYQPKVDIASGLLRSVEALARWKHPERGIVLPGKFIPVLENSDLMWPFTLQMIRMVLADLAGWQAKGMSIGVAVNLSAEALLDMALADKLEKMVKEARVPPPRLILEVTETMVMKNLSACIGNLARMRLKGFSLSMDDYGIGYSSMQQLSRCPFTELKIDRSFVDGAADHPNRRVILESSIQMGKRLGVTTIAEGVETEEDWRLLKELGCEIGQGYFVGKPMPADELIRWIKNRKAR